MEYCTLDIDGGSTVWTAHAHANKRVFVCGFLASPKAVTFDFTATIVKRVGAGSS